jgi:UDP-N-acetylmuramoyl-L-alanyl-D-glutamate--2,6-diaminopimelate ligase
MVAERELGSLVADLPGSTLVAGSSATPVRGIEHDSRQVTAGTLFAAVPGLHVDGHAFLAEAIRGGASAILVQRDREPAWGSLANRVAVVAVDDTRVALSRAAAWFYGYPSRELSVVGITGTDGKTTTSHLLTYVLEAAGLVVGRLGTVDVHIGGLTDASRTRMTTPEAPEVQRLLRAMADAGCDFAIVESTSHGLALNRLDDVEYDVAVFTNVTGDHLDFHKTFEAYREAKGRLFATLERTVDKGFPKSAVVNDDDPSANFMLGLAPGAQPIRYGMESLEADVLARNVSLRPDGTDFRLATLVGSAEVNLSLPALFNVANALAAAGAGLAVGLPPQVVAEGLTACPGVPGRMERIVSGQPFEVIVDYAHTGDAVRKVLDVLRSVSAGRLILVAGAAGERDPGRRFGVARAAAEGADFAVFTSEDPRSEDPMAIVGEIGKHAEDAGRVRERDFVEVEDRRAAIGRALAEAQPGDTVVVCGKGHEQSMIYGDTSLPWDDRQVTREELSRLGY